PPERVHPEQIPPRDYVFVVDVSGSMNGFPLKTARSLMKDLVGNLHESDTFNILLFAGGSEVLSPDPIPATRQNLSDALRWLDRAKGGGGTELLSALHRALNLQTAEGTSRSIVVVTDGYVSFEREAFETVTDNLGHANLFAFGIGSSVNRYLIEGMARVGRGEPFIVTEPKHASEQAELFRDYISAPVLTDIDIDFEGFEVYDVEPATYPDILADRPLTVFGKWRGRPRGRIDVSGATGTGPFDSSTMVDSSELNNSSLPYLWARDRIASLSDFEGPRSTDQELRQQITTLGLTYNLLTEHTSFVAVDSIVRTDPGGAIDSVKQPLPLPAGVPASAVGGGTTPAPGLIPLIIAALSALFGRRFLSRRKGEEGS
ncbi:MAG: VWA domain-containing protein, partial [Verrucomicrobiota bacterium]